MILLARALVRVVSFLLLVLLALAGLAAAAFSISEGPGGPSYAKLADLLRLPELRDLVGTWLARLEASGATAGIAALCGLGAVLLGLLLLAGLLVPRRERLVQLDEGERGTVDARRRALAGAAASGAELVRGVTEVKVRVRPGRRAGGRIRVRAFRARTADADAVKSGVSEQVRGVAEPFSLKTRVEAPLARRGGRVQ